MGDMKSAVALTVCVCVSAFAIVLNCSCCIAKTSQVTVDLFPVTMLLANYA